MNNHMFHWHWLYCRGLVGAIGVTPTTFVLPCILWLLWSKPARWSAGWMSSYSCVVFCSLVGLLGTISAIYTISQNYTRYSFISNFT